MPDPTSRRGGHLYAAFWTLLAVGCTVTSHCHQCTAMTERHNVMCLLFMTVECSLTATYALIGACWKWRFTNCASMGWPQMPLHLCCAMASPTPDEGHVRQSLLLVVVKGDACTHLSHTHIYTRTRAHTPTSLAYHTMIAAPDPRLMPCCT